MQFPWTSEKIYATLYNHNSFYTDKQQDYQEESEPQNNYSTQ